MRMQSDDSTPDPDLQWIICVEGYHIVNKMFPKELSIICIQTGDYMTGRIKYDPIIKTNDNVCTYLAQFRRHGLGWACGEHTIDEVIIALKNWVHHHSEIFIIEPHLKTMFEAWGFEDVQVLKILPPKCFDESTHCGTHPDAHQHLGNECAQQKCNEVLEFLRPALIPRLDPQLIECDVFKHPAITDKYGSHRLLEPFYHRIKKVTLDYGKNSKHGLAGADGFDGGLGRATKQDTTPNQYLECKASNSTA